MSVVTRETVAVGSYGERLAVAHLVEQGMVVLARNWRCRAGEVDIIARDGPAIVFCEVKTRRGFWFGTPVEAIGWDKAGRLRRLAAEWLATTGVHAPEVRFDVVSVLPQPRGAARVEHLRGAF
jgi:putative endonuclease